MDNQALRVDIDQAGAFAVRRQLLDGGGEPGKRGTLTTIRRLGYVQIDTINVVERAHHHVLWSRVPGYRTEMLDGLQRGRKVFEYLAHAMCYLPTADYRYYRGHMVGFAVKSKWYGHYYKKYGKLAEEVLERIKTEGPLAAGDFGDTRNRKRGTWWDWKPAKVALEMLFYRGDLMVAERRNFQRIYDLASRVLPKGIDLSLPEEAERKSFFVRRALEALGLATERDIDRYITTGGRLGAQLAAMVGQGLVSTVQVEGLPKPYYLLAELAGEFRQAPENDDTVRLLSPFDNLVILRDRTKALFGFDFALECYTPAAKRKYGYFSMPILWRDALVGRLDPKADREAGTLLVKSIHMERPVRETSFYRELAAELQRFAQFNKCVRVEMTKRTADSERWLAKHF